MLKETKSNVGHKKSKVLRQNGSYLMKISNDAKKCQLKSRSTMKDYLNQDITDSQKLTLNT